MIIIRIVEERSTNMKPQVRSPRIAVCFVELGFSAWGNDLRVIGFKPGVDFLAPKYNFNFQRIFYKYILQLLVKTNLLFMCTV